MTKLRPFSLFCSMLFAFQVAGQVAVVGSDKFELTIDDHLLKIPYFSTHDLVTGDDLVERVVISLHGNNRNADEYFDNLAMIAEANEVDMSTTMIVAPQFLTEDDIDAFDLDDEHLYWTSGGWKSGSLSRDEDSNPRPERIASYAVLDSLLYRLGEIYPNLIAVVFTGHSAGGQVSNRWAATSPMVDQVCSQFNVNTRFVVANPSSYLYLDGRRKVAGSLANFIIPATSCSDYNEWKYGLEDLFSYPSNSGATAIREMMSRREVVYLLGEEDNNPNSSSLDVSCEADFQGAHRLERGEIYFQYLQLYYGNEILENQQKVIVPDAGHNNFDMYSSDVGVFHLFESMPSACQNNPTNLGEVPAEQLFKLYPNPASDHFVIAAEHGPYTLTLRNSLGALVRSYRQIDAESFYLPIADLQAGLYWVEFRQEGVLAVQRLVIQ